MDQVPPTHRRLMEAADAVWDVADNLEAGPAANVDRHRSVLAIYDGPNRPAVLAGFARYEIEAACEFLSRLGYLEPPPKRAIKL